MTSVRPQKTTKQRGYGSAHERARAVAFARLPTFSPCCRCGHLMYKHAVDRLGRSTLHFDHTDDRRGYRGFAHSRCNAAAGGARRGAAYTPPKPQPQWQSRIW